MICSYAFSRAYRRLHVFTLSADWFGRLSESVVIGQNYNYFGFGFRTIERFPLERRKTKTKVITPTNHNSLKQLNKPIKISWQINVAGVKRGKTCADKSRFVLALLLIGRESGTIHF